MVTSEKEEALAELPEKRLLYETKVLDACRPECALCDP
jgi:hypothetical protein